MGQSFIASAFAIAASAIIGAVSLGGIRAQQSLEPVSVIVFPGGFNWPIWVAQDKGYFTSGGIEVNLTNTPNSVFQLTNLIEGKFGIAMTAIDNVIAYMEGQGEAPTQAKPDLTVFMGGDNGFLSLVTVPEVRNVTDLKGRTVSVDARTTGYAFVLFDLMKHKGLNEADYKVEKAGGCIAALGGAQGKEARRDSSPYSIRLHCEGKRLQRAGVRDRRVRTLPRPGWHVSASVGRREPA